jgi:plastocyanin
MKKVALFTLFVLTITTVLLAACGGTSATIRTNPNTVRTVGGTFAISSISIKKGSTITFVDDPNTPALHILTIGQNGQDESERGAPNFGGLAGHTIQGGDSWTTPPWNIAGTYHVTCTVHSAMNLSVIVSN